MRKSDLTTLLNTFRPSAWSCLLIMLASLALGGCERRREPLTLVEASQMTLTSKIEGVSFAVPLTYFVKDYKLGGEWPRPPRQASDASKHKSVDVLKITALLPDLAPYSEFNKDEFESTARGRKVDIYLTQRERLEIRSLDVILPRSKRMPEDQRVPGMMKFEDETSKSDYYFNTLNVGYDMVSIQCIRPDLYPFLIPSPSCVVLSGYRDRFTVKVEFHSDYLSQWSQINRGTKELLDRFVKAAESEHPAARDRRN